MKKVMVMLMAVLLCSLSAWCQVASVVSLGTKALEKNNFSVVKQMFNDEGFKIDEYAPANSRTKAVGMDGRGDASIMWSITANPNHTIKEVSFLCGLLHWYGIEQVLQDAGYTLVKEVTATLGNGATVPQKTFSKGNKRCYVQTLDNCMAQVIFKRKATTTKSKQRKITANTLLQKIIADALTSVGYLRISQTIRIFVGHSQCNRTTNCFIHFNSLIL